jgi:hypothetical protein
MVYWSRVVIGSNGNGEKWSYSILYFESWVTKAYGKVERSRGTNKEDFEEMANEIERNLKNLLFY